MWTNKQEITSGMSMDDVTRLCIKYASFKFVMLLVFILVDKHVK